MNRQEARDQVAKLEAQSAELEQRCQVAEQAVKVAEGAALNGGPVEDVQAAHVHLRAEQGIRDLALAQLDQARATLAELEQAERTAQQLSDGRQAVADMARLSDAYDQRHEAAEQAIQAALDDLARLSSEHRQAVRTLIKAMKDAEQQGTGANAFLEAVGSDLSRGQLVNSWQGVPTLSIKRDSRLAPLKRL